MCPLEIVCILAKENGSDFGLRVVPPSLLIRQPTLVAGPFLPKPVHSRRRLDGRVELWRGDFMKYDHDRVMEAKRLGALVSTCAISLEQATKIALSGVGGTPFEVKLREVDERLVWKVKLVVDGQRVKVVIDANSGRVIKAKAETAVTEPLNQVPNREELPA